MTPAAVSGLLPWLSPSLLVWGARRRNAPWSLACGKALLAWGSGIWIFTEIASALGRLDLQAALLLWTLAALAAAVWAARAPRPAEPAAPLGLGPWALPLGLGLAGVLLLLALLGLRSPITNFDSLFYHLPRVEQWVQNRGVAHFPTSYDLQDFYPPWAEMAILQARLLAGENTWASLVQWTALVGACAAVADMAGGLGGGAWAGLLAALCLAALPMANLESSTCQNDLAGALWLAWAAAFTLRHHRDGRPGDALWAAAALGLGLATKGTNYVFGLPWGLWLAWDWIRKGPRRAWMPLLLALLIAAPSAGHWWRNHRACGSWLGSSTEHRVGRLDAAGACSNLVKNLSYDALSTWGPWNLAVHRSVLRLHQALGWDLDDPQLNWAGLEYGHYIDLAGKWQEDYAGSPWHLLAGLLLTGAVAFGWRRGGPLPWALLSIVVGYTTYSILIRFNPWCNRLHLPAFVLLCAPLGLALEALLGPARRVVAGAALLAYAAWIAVSHASQPLIFLLPNESQNAMVHSVYWRSGLDSGWRAASLGGNVGLMIMEREFEYPLWVGLRQGGAQRVQQLHPTPATAATQRDPPFRDFHPDVLVLNLPSDAPPAYNWGGRRWRRDSASELWAVYVPEAAPRQGR